MDEFLQRQKGRLIERLNKYPGIVRNTQHTNFYRQHKAHALEYVERALAKIESGSYGICDDCHRPIAHERLEVLPGAIRCLECERVLADTRRNEKQ